MKKSAFWHVALGAILAVIIPACTNLNLDDIDNANFGTSIAAPIGSTSIGVNDLLSQMNTTLITTDETTGQIAVVWQGDRIQQEISLDDYSPEPVNITSSIDLKEHEPFKSAFEETPEEIDRGIKVPIDGPQYINSDIQIDYNYEDFIKESEISLDIDSMLMAKGVFDIEVTVRGVSINDENPITVELTFPYVTDNGTNIVRHTMSSPRETIQFEMNDFTVEFIDGQLTLPIMVTFTVESYNDNLYANRNATVNLDTELAISGCKKVWGLVHNDSPLYTDRIDIEMPELPFLSSGDNHIKFADPSMKITVQTDLDMPIILTIDSMYAQNADGNTVNADFGNSNRLEHMIERPAAPGDMSLSEITFDNNMGSLGKLLAINPNKLHARYSITAGDDGNEHIIPLPSHVMIDMEAEIPLAFDAGTSFSIKDTVHDIDISAATNTEGLDIQQVRLYLDITNMMPISLNAKVIFVSEDGQSTPYNGTIEIPSADVNAEGETTEASLTTQILEFTGSDIDAVMNAKDIVFEVTVQGKTPDSKIRLRTSDNISFKISAFAKAGINVDLNNL